MSAKEESIKQKEIFGKNLIRLCNTKYPKQQKDIAKEIGEYPTTFNTWCMGKSMPGMGKVQKIADYFGVPKSELLEDFNEQVLVGNKLARLSLYPELLETFEKLCKLQPNDQEMVVNLINSLYEKVSTNV